MLQIKIQYSSCLFFETSSGAIALPFHLSTTPEIMGNDGGSIARRDELVKVKVDVNAPKSNKSSSDRQQWTTCAFSKEPLREPVVADALGRVYNKEAVTQYLVQKAMNKISNEQGKGAAKKVDVFGAEVLGHIKSSKDLTTLKLTSNPSFKGPSHTSSESSSNDPLPSSQTPFICPLTSKLMNGSIRFVYIRTKESGVVLSESSLKMIINGQLKEKKESFTCPITETKFNPGCLINNKNNLACNDIGNVGDVILINPGKGSVEERVLLENSKKKKEKKEKSKVVKELQVDNANGSGKRKEEDTETDEQHATAKRKKISPEATEAHEKKPKQ
ncbi:unnamed protein product [Sympodiomycopsis kandeliae]